MSRIAWRSALAATVVGLVWISVEPAGQNTGQPSTKNGDWPAYTGDIRGSRYSPLDQINATNFKKLEVAWRFKTDNLGTRPEFKLEGTPLVVRGVVYATAGTRRSIVALDGTTGELIWAHSLREGKRAAIAPRQLSGRGLSYWTDGRGDERLLYVTTGYRLVSLNAKTGAMIPSFGKDGIVDLKTGMVTGAQQHQGPGTRVRCAIGETALDVQHHPASGRVRQRYVAERLLERERQHGRLDADLGR